MKKALLAATLVGVSAGAFAQGTVSFNDFQVSPKVYTNDLNGHSGFAKAQTFTVALYWASASGAALTPIFTGQATSATDGNFFFSGVTTPNATAPSGTAVFQVYGWTGSATSYSAAVAGGAFVGLSNPFLNGTGGGGSPPATPATLTGWTGNLVLSPVPEPTTIALGGLGAAALLLFRRRK